MSRKKKQKSERRSKTGEFRRSAHAREIVDSQESRALKDLLFGKAVRGDRRVRRRPAQRLVYLRRYSGQAEHEKSPFKEEKGFPKGILSVLERDRTTSELN